MRQSLGLTAALLTIVGALHGAEAAVPAARCHIVGEGGQELLPPKLVYPGRSHPIFKVRDVLFIELGYEPIGSTVSAVLVRMPHYPWSFGEKVVGQSALRMSDGFPKSGNTPVSAVGPQAVLSCTRTQQ